MQSISIPKPSSQARHTGSLQTPSLHPTIAIYFPDLGHLNTQSPFPHHYIAVAQSLYLTTCTIMYTSPPNPFPPSNSNSPPSPAVDYNRCTSALKFHPNFPDELEQGGWLKRDSMVWPSTVLELLHTEWSFKWLQRWRNIAREMCICVYVYMYGTFPRLQFV